MEELNLCARLQGVEKASVSWSAKKSPFSKNTLYQRNYQRYEVTIPLVNTKVRNYYLCD